MGASQRPATHFTNFVSENNSKRHSHTWATSLVLFFNWLFLHKSGQTIPKRSLLFLRGEVGSGWGWEGAVSVLKQLEDMPDCWVNSKHQQVAVSLEENRRSRLRDDVHREEGMGVEWGAGWGVGGGGWGVGGGQLQKRKCQQSEWVS